MENAQENQGKKTRNTLIISVLSVLLLLSLGYNIFQKQKSDADYSVLKIDLNDTQKAKNSLQTELNTLKEDYNKTKINNTTLDSLLFVKDKDIIAKQQKIQELLNKGNVTKNDLTNAKRLIASLQDDIKSYKTQIDLLKQENSILVTKNDSIKKQSDKFSNQLTQEKEANQKYVQNINSTLSISNYQIVGLKVRSNGKEVETTRARRIDKIKVSFDIDKNPNTNGEKELFVAIYKPNGELGIFKNATPGELNLRNGQTIKYSDKVKFNYQQGTLKPIQFDWENESFDKGNYRVVIYQNNFKIGEKNIILK